MSRDTKIFTRRDALVEAYGTSSLSKVNKAPEPLVILARGVLGLILHTVPSR